MTSLPTEIASALYQDEQVIWTGKPLPGRYIWTLQRLLLSASAALSFCAIVAMIFFGGRSLGAWLGPIFAVGVLSAFGLSLWNWFVRSELGRLSRTTYAITFERVLVFEDGVHTAARSLKIDGPREPYCDPQKDGTVSIWLVYSLTKKESFGHTSIAEIDRELVLDGLERLCEHTAALNALTIARTAKLGLQSEQGRTEL